MHFEFHLCYSTLGLYRWFSAASICLCFFIPIIQYVFFIERKWGIIMLLTGGVKPKLTFTCFLVCYKMKSMHQIFHEFASAAPGAA